VTIAYIAALGKLESHVLDTVEKGLIQALGVQVIRLDPLDEPLYAFDADRRQYSSVKILQQLTRHGCVNHARLLGLTEVDLFMPTLSFVFGQARLGGNAAIVSLARLRQEFYYLPPQAHLLEARARKECIHEMGHTFGLTHCSDPRCPMSIATSIQQVDSKGELFCATCAVQLRNILKRMRNLPDDTDHIEEH
jgi:archaemetzincin